MKIFLQGTPIDRQLTVDLLLEYIERMFEFEALQKFLDEIHAKRSWK